VTTATALRLADTRDAAGLSDFLTRLLRYDRAAAVRLRTVNQALAVFARLPLGDSGPLVIRTALLAPTEPPAEPLDRTVSVGQLLDAIAPDDTDATTEPGDLCAELRLPPPITGPAWAGVLPPRTNWEHIADLPTEPLSAAVQAAVAEFRGESESPNDLAEAIWSRQVHPSGLTLRALHAAHLVGVLQQSDTVALHRHPAWLRLTAPRGSVITRRAPAPGAGLGLTPTR
jgi:hypothetical protein